MPGLVADAVSVSSWIGQGKSKTWGMPFEPLKGGGEFERLLQIRVAGRTDVEGSTRVVFAKAGRRDVTQDGVERLAGLEFGADKLGLARDRAEA